MTEHAKPKVELSQQEIDEAVKFAKDHVRHISKEVRMISLALLHLHNALPSPLSADADAAEWCALVAYQVIGALAHYASLFEHQEVQRVLDFFSGNGPWTEEFLPWPKVQLRHTPAATTDFKALAVEFEKLFEAWLHTPASYPLVNPRGDLEQFLWDNKA